MFALIAVSSCYNIVMYCYNCVTRHYWQINYTWFILSTFIFSYYTQFTVLCATNTTILIQYPRQLTVQQYFLTVPIFCQRSKFPKCTDTHIAVAIDTVFLWRVYTHCTEKQLGRDSFVVCVYVYREALTDKKQTEQQGCLINILTFLVKAMRVFLSVKYLWGQYFSFLYL